MFLNVATVFALIISALSFSVACVELVVSIFTDYSYYLEAETGFNVSFLMAFLFFILKNRIFIKSDYESHSSLGINNFLLNCVLKFDRKCIFLLALIILLDLASISLFFLYEFNYLILDNASYSWFIVNLAFNSSVILYALYIFYRSVNLNHKKCKK